MAQEQRANNASKGSLRKAFKPFSTLRSLSKTKKPKQSSSLNVLPVSPPPVSALPVSALPVSALPHELLPEILVCLSNNVAALNKCARVSRYWCQTTVPILWRNPFDLCDGVESRSYRLLQTCMSLFSKTEREFFREFGIKLPPKWERSKFDYLSYVRDLDNSLLSTTIFRWSMKADVMVNHKAVTHHFFKTLAGRARQLHRMSLSFHLCKDRHSQMELEPLFTILETRHVRIRQLSVFFDYERQNLMPSQVNKVAALLAAQRHVQQLDIYYASANMNEILDEVVEHRNSIRVLQFSNCDFTGMRSLDQLTKCTKLVEIWLHECSNAQTLGDGGLVSRLTKTTGDDKQYVVYRDSDWLLSKGGELVEAMGSFGGRFGRII